MRLEGFADRVERIVERGGGTPRGSRLLDGVFFSADIGFTTFERSRSFDVDRVEVTSCARSPRTSARASASGPC